MCPLGVHRNSDIRANDSTKGAADTAGRVVHLRKEVSAPGDLLGHRENLLRTGLDTQLASLALVFVNYDSRHLNYS